MKRIDPADIPALVNGARGVLQSNPTWSAARVYPFGFVANAYRWRAPAERLWVPREGAYRIEVYDQKRANGRGSRIVRAPAT